jgi:ketosteroid isomerase-like protein
MNDPRISQSVALARRYYELVNAHDFEGCAQLLADDFELFEPSLPDGGSFHGREGFLRWAAGVMEVWPEIRWDPERFIDCGQAAVIPVRVVARARHTELEQTSSRFQLVRVRDGQITYATGYGKLERALAAAGAG